MGSASPPLLTSSLRGLLSSDLTTLRHIVAVCEGGSLSGAAATCHQSVAAVSKRIKEFEQRLGVQLFDRHARGMVPTEAGRLILAFANSVLELSRDAARQLDALHVNTQRRVALYANASALSQYLPGDLSAFAAEHAWIQVETAERPSSSMLDDLLAGKADLAIHDSRYTGRGLASREYRQERYVALTPIGHPLLQTSTEKATLMDLLAHPMVTFPRGTAAQSHVDREADALGLTPLTRLQAHSLEAGCHFAASGIGTAIVPAGMAQRWVDAGLARSLVLDEPWAWRSLQLSWSELRPLTPAAETFRDFLLSRRPL